MANAQLSQTLARFTAKIHRSRNRLVAIPGEIQDELGLARKADNDLILVSLRPQGNGRWNHHYLKLTRDNEFSIPADVTRLQPGDTVDVRIHQVVRDQPPVVVGRTAASVLLELMKRPRRGWRTDGSQRVDEYLNADIQPSR